MEDFLIIPCLNCIKITQKQAWWSLIYFAWLKSMYFREYVCRFSRKLHYFCILGVSHLKMCQCVSSLPLFFVFMKFMQQEICSLNKIYVVMCKLHFFFILGPFGPKGIVILFIFDAVIYLSISMKPIDYGFFMLYKLRSVQNTGTCYPGQGWFVRNLGWGR